MKISWNKRTAYLLATVLIFLLELFIALFVRDNFIRPYVGDILVVVLVYTCVRVFFLRDQGYCHCMCFCLQQEWKLCRECESWNC